MKARLDRARGSTEPLGDHRDRHPLAVVQAYDGPEIGRQVKARRADERRSFVRFALTQKVARDGARFTILDGAS